MRPRSRRGCKICSNISINKFAGNECTDNDLKTLYLCNYLTGNSLIVRRDERSSDFKEVSVISIFVIGRSDSFSSESSKSISVDFHKSFVRDSAITDLLLLLLDSGIEISNHLVLNGLFTASPDSLVLDLILESLVVNLVDEQLVWVVVQRGELDFSVGLVNENSFLFQQSTYGTVLHEVGRGFAPEWVGEGVSESNQEELLELLVSVEELLEVSRQVSIGLVGCVNSKLPLKKE